MEQYTVLARHYDQLMDSATYDKMANRISALLAANPLPVSLVLEVACGTGALTHRLARRGWEMLSVDISPDMLEQARQSCLDLPVPPVLICQDMLELDLYGTVQAAICCTDSLNYLWDIHELNRALGRISLFLEAGGLFIFDIKSPQMFARMSGSASVYEGDGLFCAWQYGYDAKSFRGQHQVDIFEGRGHRCTRYSEVHYQRAFTRAQVEAALLKAGLKVKGVYKGYTGVRQPADAGRLMYVCQKI